MPQAGRAARIAIGALSIAAHLGLLAVVAVQAPVLVIPRELAGPPEPIIPILIAPRRPPKTPGGPPGDPIRLHRRLLRPGGSHAVVPPLVTEHPAPVAAPKAAGGPPRETIEADLRSAQVAALWRLRLGCGDPDTFHLTREERDACDQRLAAAAKATPPVGLALPSDKAIVYDRAAARAEEARREREAPPPVGAAPPSASTLQPWKLR